jgi:putative CocE/NonD family hydrolase
MKRRAFVLSTLSGTVSAATLATAPYALAQQPEPENAAEELDVEIQFFIRIPMRDGIHLSATLYLPTGQQQPKPAIFAMTPYIADREHPEAIYFARHGYPSLAVDERGRGNSEGEYAPFFNADEDGHDVVEWIARQPWCNGKVAMRGLSFVGYTQWATVRGEPPHLASIVPAAPCWGGLDYPFRHNVFYTFAASWMMWTLGNARQDLAFADMDFVQGRQIQFMESGLPFRQIDTFFGFERDFFDVWLDHPQRDEFWDDANPTPEQLGRLSIPVLSLCGMYDGDQPGTLEFHRQHLQHAGDKANHYLVIGPWDHAGTRNPKEEFLGLKVGKSSVLDMKDLHVQWYAWTMEDGPRPEFLKKKVAYYVMETDEWRYVDTLQEATVGTQTLYLQSSGNPSNVFQSGALTSSKPARSAEPDQYVYDPSDLGLPKFESTLTNGDLWDQRLVLSPLGSKLVYHTEPMEADLEISGFFKATLWLAIDQPDTDFNVAIYDFHPDGRCLYLTEQHFRARYRESMAREKLIDTTEPLQYDFDKFFFVARCIRKGHRLRMVVQANHSINWQKNYNSGKPVADETMADARTVTVKLYHDAAHPSSFSIPLGKGAPKDEVANA